MDKKREIVALGIINSIAEYNTTKTKKILMDNKSEILRKIVKLFVETKKLKIMVHIGEIMKLLLKSNNTDDETNKEYIKNKTALIVKIIQSTMQHKEMEKLEYGLDMAAHIINKIDKDKTVDIIKLIDTIIALDSRYSITVKTSAIKVISNIVDVNIKEANNTLKTLVQQIISNKPNMLYSVIVDMLKTIVKKNNKKLILDIVTSNIDYISSHNEAFKEEEAVNELIQMNSKNNEVLGDIVNESENSEMISNKEKDWLTSTIDQSEESYFNNEADLENEPQEYTQITEDHVPLNKDPVEYKLISTSSQKEQNDNTVHDERRKHPKIEIKLMKR